MFVTKLKIALGFVLLLAVVGAGMGFLAHRMVGQVAAVPIGETPPKEPAGGKEVNGLKLTLSADRAETVMKADGSNAEPVKLSLTFTNVSDKPIKLNPLSLWRVPSNREDAKDFFRFTITGPDKDSVRAEDRNIRATMTAVTEADLAEIKPGASLTKEISILKEGGPIIYSLLKAGEYRVRADYTGKTLPGLDLWTGTLASNEMVLTVKPAK